MRKNKKRTEEISLERLSCIGTVILMIGLIIATIKNFIFFPALLIMISLVLFTMCSIYKDDKDRELFVNIIFGIGISLIIFATIYTIVKTV